MSAVRWIRNLHFAQGGEPTRDAVPQRLNSIARGRADEQANEHSNPCFHMRTSNRKGKGFLTSVGAPLVLPYGAS